jgi:predicted GNAT family acetyltransferase
MLITTYQDPDDFLLRTHPTLEKDEATNGLLLGIASSIKNSSLYSTYYLATIEDEIGLLVAACMTPPHNLILYSRDSREASNEAAFTLLLQNLQNENWPVPGVIGPALLAENFAHIWAKVAGRHYRVGILQRLFVLDQVIPPEGAPGQLRVAAEDDLDLMKHWMFAFDQEAVHGDDQVAAWRRAELKVRDGDIYIWETPDKRIVSMAGKTRPLTNVISVGPVYTPPELRGHGYASNCVAALSQLLLDEGWKYCSLFTDLSNPTSNSIYQKMGYRPVCDFKEYVFVS